MIIFLHRDLVYRKGNPILLANLFPCSGGGVSESYVLGFSGLKEAVFGVQFTALRSSPTVSEGLMRHIPGHSWRRLHAGESLSSSHLNNQSIINSLWVVVDENCWHHRCYSGCSTVRHFADTIGKPIAGGTMGISEKWFDVITHPLGLAGFALFLVFLF